MVRRGHVFRTPRHDVVVHVVGGRSASVASTASDDQQDLIVMLPADQATADKLRQLR